MCALGESRRIKQKIKKLKKTKKVYLRNHNRCFFTCSPRPPTLSQRYMDLHVWSYPRPDYIFRVSSKSVQGFRSPGGSKFGLSHYFGYSLLQQLVLPYKPWHCRPSHIRRSIISASGIMHRGKSSLLSGSKIISIVFFTIKVHLIVFRPFNQFSLRNRDIVQI